MYLRIMRNPELGNKVWSYRVDYLDNFMYTPCPKNSITRIYKRPNGKVYYKKSRWHAPVEISI